MNGYYFAVTYWNKPTQEVYKKHPILASSYAESLESLYKDSRIIGARVVALHLWSGRHLVKRADLFSPSSYDVPDFTLK